MVNGGERDRDRERGENLYCTVGLEFSCDCTVLYSIVLYSTVVLQYSTVACTVRYCTVQYRVALLYCTVLYRTRVLYSTVPLTGTYCTVV